MDSRSQPIRIFDIPHRRLDEAVEVLALGVWCLFRSDDAGKK